MGDFIQVYDSILTGFDFVTALTYIRLDDIVSYTEAPDGYQFVNDPTGLKLVPSEKSVSESN